MSRPKPPRGWMYAPETDPLIMRMAPELREGASILIPDPSQKPPKPMQEPQDDRRT